MHRWLVVSNNTHDDGEGDPLENEAGAAMLLVGMMLVLAMGLTHACYVYRTTKTISTYKELHEEHGANKAMDRLSMDDTFANVEQGQFV